MLTITKLLNNFQKLDTEKLIKKSLTETIPRFETIQKEQLKFGKTNTGEKITPKYRNRKYAAAKNERNPLPGLGTPDLLLTGEFQRLLDVQVGTDVLDIVSKDDKGPELEDKYKNIFGLGKGFKKEYITKDLRPVIKEKVTLAIGLKFS